MERWRFILARSSDLSHIAELQQARGRQVSVIHNRGGSLSFNFPMEHELASYIDPITTCVKAFRRNSKANAWECEWSGPVWTIDESIHEARMTVNCVGWLAHLEKRLLRVDKTYSNLDDSEIIRLLLEHANRATFEDFAYNVPLPASWANPATRTHIDWGGTRHNDWPFNTVAYTTATRNKSYQKFTSIGAAINEMTELENGCDIWVDPETRLLYTHRKKEVVTAQVFGYNWGPANVAQFGRQLDASTVVNFMQTTGRPGSTPQYADTASGFQGWRVGNQGANDPSPDTRQEYGLMEEVTSLPDVADNGVLAVYGAAEVFLRYRPRIIYSLTPFPFTEGSSVPEPFVDYTVGDRVKLTAKLPPRITIENQGVRVFGISVSIDEEGNERIGSLQTSPT